MEITWEGAVSGQLAAVSSQRSAISLREKITLFFKLKADC